MRRRWYPGNWPLGVQLALAFTLVALLALGGGGVFLVNQTEDRQLAQRTEKVLQQAQVAARLAQETRFIGSPDALPLALYSLQQQIGVRPVVLDAKGAVVADSWLPSPFQGQTATHPEVATALAGNEATGYRQLSTGEWVVYAAVPMKRGPDGPVAGVTLVSADLSDVAANLADLKRQIIVVVTLAGLLTLAVSLGLSRYLARPIERLHEAATGLALGQMETRVLPGGSSEVMALGQQFNVMAQELQRIDEQRRDFVASASHELRTPVALVRALAEALLGDTQGDLAVYKEYLGDIVKECERAGHLVDRLLELARLDERRGGQAHAQPVDLANLCLELSDSFQPMAAKHQVQLLVEVPDAVWLQTDAFLVETVVTNLTENALKYTPVGGEVQVTLTQSADAVRIQVADTGPGIPPEHLPHLFERFYRVDKSRARATGGVGLGLSIVAQSAALLGGRIEVDSAVSAGSRFTLVLPVPKALN